MPSKAKTSPQTDIVSADPNAADVLDAYPPDIREALAELRELILQTAKTTDGVGPLEETLKWGQVSYLTSATKSGTTIRIDADDSHGGDAALYVNCQTNLVDEWRERYPDLVFGGTRSVHFRLGDPLPDKALKHMIAMALTYHARKNRSG